MRRCRNINNKEPISKLGKRECTKVKASKMPTKIVCMQVEQASLLVDNVDEWVSIGNG